MSRTLNFDDFVRMLRGASERVKADHEALSRLDSFGGDGDHGTTMLRATRGLERILESPQSATISELLREVGWSILGVDGGAIGPLLGMFFTGMADAAGALESFGAEDLARVFESGLAAVERQTPARVGDKTLMDALVPAVRALRDGTGDGADVGTALRLAAKAASAGAESTKALEARFGRAKNVGPRSVGHADPGATSVSLIFQGFVQGFVQGVG